MKEIIEEYERQEISLNEHPCYIENLFSKSQNIGYEFQRLKQTNERGIEIDLNREKNRKEYTTVQ